jgi:8-oxo-dGTP pyrophosphatase MutT (NUDIX family)
MRETLVELIGSIRPHDALEAEHIASTLAWMASGAPLYRLHKADDPPQHLVAYFVLYDAAARKLLLVDHKKAGLWLPSGGHVEPDEHPQTTVQREALEELGIVASFLLATPLFLTVTATVGTVASHVDVSLWYLLQGDCTQPLWFDETEFHRIAWFVLDALPLERSDPHLARFVAKFRLWALAYAANGESN